MTDSSSPCFKPLGFPAAQASTRAPAAAPTAWLMVLLLAADQQPAVAANTPIVSASVSGYYATASGGGPIPEALWQNIVVSRNDRSNHAEARGNGGHFYSGDCFALCNLPTFTSAGVGGFASAEPGVLRIYGAALASARNGLNGFDTPTTPNGDSAYAGIQATAGFTDYLTVIDPGKAVGMPVKVPLKYVAEFIGGPGLTHPSTPLTVFARFDMTGLGPQIFSTQGFLPYFRETPVGDGNTLYTLRSDDDLSVDARVGDVLTISAFIGVYGSARITDYQRQQEIGAYVDGRNTAGIWLGRLPDGMVITSASGHDYRIDPTTLAATVPEPGTLALLAAGLGWGLGWRVVRAGVQRRGVPVHPTSPPPAQTAA